MSLSHTLGARVGQLFVLSLLLALAHLGLGSLLEGQRHASTVCGRRRGVPPQSPLGERARYVARSYEAQYALIQIARWGLFVPIPTSRRITARDMPPPTTRKGVFLSQTCLRD